MAELLKEVKELTDLSKQYVELRLEIIKSEVSLKASDMVSTLAIGITIAAMAGGALLILSFGLAHAIGQRLGNTAYGFYIMGGVYLLATLLLFIMGKTFLKRYIQNSIIRDLETKS